MSINMFASPSSYVQGHGALLQSAPYLKRLGTKAVLLADPMPFKLYGQKFVDYLQKEGLDVKVVQFQGESSDNEIKRVDQIAKDENAELIIGFGGGKTSDTAKASADDLKIKVAVLPTLASTDAPCSRLSVIYKDSGEFEKYRFFNANPDLVLVDTQIVANAPAKLLACGIADALATNVEAKAISQANELTMLNEHQTLVGAAIAQKCEDTLFAYAHEAISAVEAHADTKALDKVVEANTLMSGVGFESGGLAAAHAINDGLSVLDGPVHTKMHGEKVSFGTLTQLMLEGVDEAEFLKYFNLLHSLNLPTNFQEIGIEDPSDENLLKVAQASCSPNDTMGRMPFDVEPDDVVQAMRGVDAYSVHAEK